MAFSPPAIFDGLQGNSCMNFKGDELKYLDELDQSQALKISKEYGDMSNFYMT